VLDQAYELPRRQRAAPAAAVATVALLAAAGYGAVQGHLAWATAALAVAASMAVATVLTLWEPYRVVVTDGGVTLHAYARDTTIPWHELAGVVIVTNNRSDRLRWVRVGGGHEAIGLPPGHFALLTEVQHRAPHVRVLS
jgi:hypothetical protein